MVNISQLRRSDAGKYWCGVSRNGPDVYTEVTLKVEPDSCCDKVSEVEVSEGESASFVCQGTGALKYLCKASKPSVCLRDALITSRHSSNSRISLTEGGSNGLFVWRIRNVKREDSGRYLSGVKRNPGPDDIRSFMLKVKDWCCEKTLRVTGTAGKPLTIQCHYQAQRAGQKIFVCKGERRDSCTDVAPSANMELRLTSVDTVFEITMREVSTRDAGTYWCGAEPRWSAGTYTQYHLTVDVPQIQSTTAPTTYQSVITAKTPVAELVLPLYVIVPALLGFLLVALVVALLVWRCKLRKLKEAQVSMKTAEEEELYSDDNDYENVEKPNTAQRGPQIIHSQEDEEASVHLNAATEQVYCNDSVFRNRETSNLSREAGRGQKPGKGCEMGRMNRK
ncbi:CMRF35-like molecule 8 [Synchiropus splendidus]|uniref:CMRF35-like molecule 8 n=1 Tax=Synchiropus splendidus TaxID=270530 RepID=UPI00237DB262|nr:CMRF35-like molecule 8 [Synchiropus splendidus]